MGKNKSNLRSILICQNHLAQLYESLENDDLKSVENLEHKLTKEEECVACAYLFKAKGESKDAFKEFLISHGYRV